MHPDYIPSKRYNDIALIKVQFDILFSSSVRPACLPYNNNEHDYKTAVATGWGRKSNDDDTSKTLSKVMLNIILNNECQKYIEPERRRLPNGVVDTQICAGVLTGGRDTCQVKVLIEYIILFFVKLSLNSG